MNSEKTFQTFLIALVLSLAMHFCSYAKNSSVEKHTVFIPDNQQLISFSDARYDSFLQRIDYNRKSIKYFFKSIFNNRNYAEQFLALNFSHTMQLLNFSNMSDQPCAYVKSVAKIFTKKTKESSYINAYAFSELLEKLPGLIGKHFNGSADKQKNAIKECLYDFLISNFSALKRDPENALDELSHKIHALTEGKNAEYDIPVRELQYAIKEFLEIALSKIIWSVEDQHEVWQSVKCISEQLQVLLVYHIIDDISSLDELFWTLLTRFNYFLSMAEELDPACYLAMEKDLATLQAPLWSIEEAEEHLTTKADFLKQAIVTAQIRSHAFKRGMITDRIAPLYQRA